MLGETEIIVEHDERNVLVAYQMGKIAREVVGIVLVGGATSAEMTLSVQVNERLIFGLFTLVKCPVYSRTVTDTVDPNAHLKPIILEKFDVFIEF